MGSHAPRGLPHVCTGGGCIGVGHFGRRWAAARVAAGPVAEDGGVDQAVDQREPETYFGKTIDVSVLFVQ